MHAFGAKPRIVTVDVNPTPWYPFAGVCALRTYGRGVGARLAPLQVGVGTPGGTETVAHALASALASVLAEDPLTAVISVDMANAFNSIHRAAMFAAMQLSAPALLQMVQWAYAEVTTLHIVGAPDGAPPVMSQRGVRQGCCSRSRCSQCWSGLMQRVRRHRLCRTWTT